MCGIDVQITWGQGALILSKTACGSSKADTNGLRSAALPSLAHPASFLRKAWSCRSAHCTATSCVEALDLEEPTAVCQPRGYKYSGDPPGAFACASRQALSVTAVRWLLGSARGSKFASAERSFWCVQAASFSFAMIWSISRSPPTADSRFCTISGDCRTVHARL